MYTAYFGLRESPFRLTANPRFLYATSHFRSVHDTLVNSLREGKPFILLTGEVGTGKTTLLHKLLDDLNETYAIALVDHTTLPFSEILTAVCGAFHLPAQPEDSDEQKIHTLNSFCLRQRQTGKGVVLLLDEGQNLQESALERLPLLFVSAPGEEPRLQLLLAGQPELEEQLRTPRLQELRRSISQSCRLDCLSLQEIGPFIRHRLQAAGAEHQELFSPRAVELIAHGSQGIPRLINVICDNALHITYTRAPRTVSAETIETVLEEMHLQQPTTSDPQVALDPDLPPGGGQELKTKLTVTPFRFVEDRRFWAGTLSGVLLASALALLFSFSQFPLQRNQPQVMAQNEPLPMSSPLTDPVSSTQSTAPKEDFPTTPPSPIAKEEALHQEQAVTSSGIQTPGTPAPTEPKPSVSPTPDATLPVYSVGYASVAPTSTTILNRREAAPQVTPERSARAVAVAKRAKGQPTQRRRELSNDEKELFQAVFDDDANMVDRLLDAGVSPNATSRGGWTPLMWATIDGRLAVARKLLNHGASVNVKNNRGMTPLMYAAWNGHGALLRLFLEHGARIQDRDRNGATALHYAQDPWAKFTRKEERLVIVELLTTVSARK
jgi:general secretion pathway protein A